MRFPIAVTGSRGSERSVRIWNVQVNNSGLLVIDYNFGYIHKNGSCLRFLRIENNVRCFDFNSERLVTGDDDGYIVFWDLRKCLDPETGPDSLSYRSHNTYVEVRTWVETLSLTDMFRATPLA